MNSDSRGYDSLRRREEGELMVENASNKMWEAIDEFFDGKIDDWIGDVTSNVADFGLRSDERELIDIGDFREEVARAIRDAAERYLASVA